MQISTVVSECVQKYIKYIRDICETVQAVFACLLVCVQTYAGARVRMHCAPLYDCLLYVRARVSICTCVLLMLSSYVSA